MSAQRHPATTDAWEWLEKGEGRERSEEQRAHIRGLLEQMDRELLKLDADTDWPVPRGIAEDYWESAE